MSDPTPVRRHFFGRATAAKRARAQEEIRATRERVESFDEFLSAQRKRIRRTLNPPNTLTVKDDGLVKPMAGLAAGDEIDVRRK